MNISDALVLVMEKYLEEQKGITTGAKAEDYKRALEEYPVTMTTAHHIWSGQIAKDLP